MGRPRTVERILAMAEVFAAISSVKHRTWKYEREARIIVNQRNAKPDASELITNLVSQHRDGKEVHWREPLVRTSRGRDVRYLDFEFGRYIKGRAEPTRAIETIVRGPRCEISAEEINALLFAEGFAGYRVIQSECEVQ